MTKKIAFIVGIFPAASETFIIDQVAGLIDRGWDVQIFSFRQGDDRYAAERYHSYQMARRVRYLHFPKRWWPRAWVASAAAWSLLIRQPRALLRALNVFRYRADAWSLKLLCWAGSLVALNAPVVHCHFGTVADQYRVLRSILGDRRPFITSLYGYDVSQIPRQKGRGVYQSLIAACSQFLVMSEDMKRRVVGLGFPEEKVVVHPVGIVVDRYPFRERADHANPVRLITVARLVEKKGIDDLIRALARVRSQTTRTISCTIVGDGPLRESLATLALQESVSDMMHWAGFLSQEDMIVLLGQSDLYIQPSKTAANGDME